MVERNLNQCCSSINDYQSDSSDDILDEGNLNKCGPSISNYQSDSPDSKFQSSDTTQFDDGDSMEDDCTEDDSSENDITEDDSTGAPRLKTIKVSC